MAANARQGPLTIGTAGHIDHGKTALVRALTGVDTDKAPEERVRGLTIALGYAPLELPSGRRLSVIDVPGHERFVRTMVAGATGFDGFLLVLAANDGPMPQTLEHLRVLRALGLRQGVIAVTKADLAAPGPAVRAAAELAPGLPAVVVCARTGQGLPQLLCELDRLTARLVSRAASDGRARLHVDRSFTIQGRGAVVTGTLWSGEIEVGQTLHLAHATGVVRQVRVRGLEIHGAPVACASAGQRVAANLTGIRAREAGRGDVLIACGAGYQSTIIDCALELDDAKHNERVQVHHGTRETPARLCLLGDGLFQLRLERPLAAADGDRVVLRRLAPPDTLGGGIVLDVAARRHGAKPEVVHRLASLREGVAPAAVLAPVPPAPPLVPASAGVLAKLEQRLREAGRGMLSESQMEGELEALRELRRQGRAARVSGRLYAHADVLSEVRREILCLIEREGSVTLAGVRDALSLSRRSSEAFLTHLDAARETRRLPDDRRVLVRR